MGPPASEAKIALCEAALSFTLPADFRQSLRCHDGVGHILFLVGEYRLWPLSDIVEQNLQDESNFEHEAEMLHGANDDGLIRGCLFSQGWMTIGDDGGASQLAIDFDPGAQGTSGQIISLYEDGVEYVADGFSSFLTGIVEDIESGALVWNEAAGQYWRTN